MKTYIEPRTLRLIALALLTLALAEFRAHSAAPLPNAWQITDNSAAGGSLWYYTNLLSDAHRTAATNQGFRFSVQGRFVADLNGSKTMTMVYGLGTQRYQLWWYLDANNDLVGELQDGPAFLLTTNGTGTQYYHTHEIIYDPGSRTASYTVDGVLLISNVAPNPLDWPAGTITWGAGSSAGKGRMNFQRVSFEITNTIVARYDAGYADSSIPAPDPATNGWVRHPATPLAGTAATNITADAVALPMAPGATTLSAGDVQPYQAVLSGSAVPGGLLTSSWFEWGTTTEYGSFTTMRRWLSGVTNAPLSEAIAGLSKGVTYHFRGVASNILGVAYGQDGAFSTPPTWVVTTLADSGPGALRQAINRSVSGDSIVFAVSGTIVLGGSALFITNDLTIVGPGPANLAISGNDSTQVLLIGGGSTTRISGLTVRDGLYFLGAGVQNFGTLLMSNCAITTNATYDGSVTGTSGVGGNGAGIYNLGTLTLISCTVSTNHAGAGRDGGNGADGVILSPSGQPGSDGRAGGNGGGIYNAGSLTLVGCTIHHNTAGGGGRGGTGGNGLFPNFYGGGGGQGGGGGLGGGIYNGTSGAILTLTNCTLYANSAGPAGRGGSGGGHSAGWYGGSGGDGGVAGNGGGIYNAATLALTACTVSMNIAGRGGRGGTDGPGILLGGESSVGGDGGGIFTVSTVPTMLRNTLLATNQPGLVAIDGVIPPWNGKGADLWGTNFLSHGHNLVAHNDGEFVLLNRHATDVMPPTFARTNAAITPLADNGGATPTISLLPASPALNAGDDTLALTLFTDQRGGSRQSGAHVDIGAFEAQVTVLNTNDSGPGSLRDTLLYCLPSDIITFDPVLSGQTIRLTGGQLTVSKPLALDASALAGGIVLDAGGNSRVFEIATAIDVTLDSLTVTKGSAWNGGGILVNPGGALTLNRTTVAGNSAVYAGGIDNRGMLALIGSAVTGNRATNNSGGVENNGGLLVIESSVISSNVALYGGGFGNWSSGTIRITNSTFAGNLANERGGGGNNVNGTITIHGSTFQDNVARSGGAVYNLENGIATLNNSTLSRNRATERGAGIVNNASTLTVINSTFSGNQAGTDGGGIVNDLGTLAMTNAIVAGNSAATSANLSGTFSGANNLTSGSPLLASLGYYGGPTATMPPLPGSPAINAGMNSVTNFLATDQRGYRRRSGASVDVGAVEMQQGNPNNPPVLTQPALLSDGALQLSFTNDPAITFSVYATTNVALPSNLWLKLGIASQPSPGQYQFIDLTATNYPQRYYKVVWP